MSESDAPKIVLVAGRPLTFFVGEFFTELGTSDNCRDNLIRFYDQQFSYIALPLNIRQCKNSMFTEAKYVRILACPRSLYMMSRCRLSRTQPLYWVFFLPVCQTWLPMTDMPRQRKMRQSAVEPIIFMKQLKTAKSS